MEINSNDFNDTHEENHLNFDTNKNSVNSSWKELETKEPQPLLPKKIQRADAPLEFKTSIKNKNFTFVQSEIDAEMAKDILYSDTGFQVNGVIGNLGENNNGHVRDSKASKFFLNFCFFSF